MYSRKNIQMKPILLLQIFQKVPEQSWSAWRTCPGEPQTSIKEPNKLVHIEFYIWFLPMLLSSDRTFSTWNFREIYVVLWKIFLKCKNSLQTSLRRYVSLVPHKNQTDYNINHIYAGNFRNPAHPKFHTLFSCHAIYIPVVRCFT